MNPSLITSHEPDAQCFNTDGNGGIPQIANTMLLQSGDVTIRDLTIDGDGVWRLVRIRFGHDHFFVVGADRFRISMFEAGAAFGHGDFQRVAFTVGYDAVEARRKLDVSGFGSNSEYWIGRVRRIKSNG